jgi:hypothetical protein
MQTTEIKGRPKPRLTGIKQAGQRLGKTRYQIMNMIAAGLLEAELVDSAPKIVVASVERIEAAAR